MTTNTDSSPIKETNIDVILLILVFLLGVITCIPLSQKYGDSIKLKLKRLVTRDAHVVILSTYGPSVQGSPFYETYVDKAVKYMLNPSNKVSELIIVGGYTVDPNTSQSQAVLDYIREKYPSFDEKKIPITLDECGITTWQNIRNAKRLMDKESISPGKITIFAEESRKEKVFIFSLSEFIAKNASVKDFLANEAVRSANAALALSREKQLELYNVSPHTMIVPNDPEYFKKITLDIITESAKLPQKNVEDEVLNISREIKEYYEPAYGKQAIKERLDIWTQAAGFDTVKNLVEKGCADYKQFLSK